MTQAQARVLLDRSARKSAAVIHSMAKEISRKVKASPAPDGLDSLGDDGSVVQRLFREFDRLADDADPSRKAELAKAICREIGAKTRGAGDEP